MIKKPLGGVEGNVLLSANFTINFPLAYGVSSELKIFMASNNEKITKNQMNNFQ